MKRKSGEPATKADLERFVTKADLERFATKEDLAREVKRLATRKDLDELAAVVRRRSLRIVKVETAVEDLRDDVLAAIKGSESRMTARMDSFMSNTMRVDRDNILLVHRMDKVEGRVSALERRAS